MPALRAEWHPCTSGAVKRGVGTFVRRCEGIAFSPANMKSSSVGDAERLADPPSLSAVFCRPSSLDFSDLSFGKMPRSRAGQRVRFWCGIKAGGRLRAHLPLTPPRNAGRDKGFRDFQKARNRWSVCTPWCCVRWSFNGKSASFPHDSSVLWVAVTGGFHAIWQGSTRGSKFNPWDQVGGQEKR